MKRDNLFLAYVVIGIASLLLLFVVKVELMHFSIAFLVGGAVLVLTIIHQVKRIKAVRSQKRGDDEEYDEEEEE